MPSSTATDVAIAAVSYRAHLEVLQQRWSDALATTGHALAMVSAGAPANHFLDDQHPAFRANPHLQQWLPGQAEAHALLLIVPGQPARLYCHAPTDFWHLPPEPPAGESGLLEVQAFSTLGALREAAGQAAWKALGNQGQGAWIGPEAPPDDLPVAHNPQDLLDHLHFLRATKTGFEIHCLRQATATAVTGHLAAAAAFQNGASEYEIHMQYLVATGHTERELPYPSIIALNQHAGTLHYQHYDRTPPQPYLNFLIDAGANHLGYAADISRSYASAERDQAGAQFAALIDALDERQRWLVAQVRPGANYGELHVQAHRQIGELLNAFGLIRCSSESAYEQRITDAFFPHGLGHFLGLQTHDVGGYLQAPDGRTAPAPERFPALRLTRTIEPGQVFTVEPGLYFIPTLLEPLRNGASAKDIAWAEVDALLPYGGIRIEDNVLVTPEGTENLTRDAFARAGA
jgi:Xaa-Pro dipeptidase